MEEKVALFMARLSELKSAIHGSPQKLAWAAEQSVELQDLCYKLDSIYKGLCRHFAVKDSRSSFVSTPSFENQWNEYSRDYAPHVAVAARPAHERSLQQLREVFSDGEEDWIKSGKTKEEYWEMVSQMHWDMFPLGSTFDPVKDNPASLVASAIDLLWDILANEYLRETVVPEEHYGDHYEKAIGAWQFFKNTIRLDLAGIYARWRKAPELFIQPHVAQVEDDPLVTLYDEAVRTYVYGNRVAAVAMCRAIMEHVLENHYKVKDKDLETTIAIAEQRFPQLKKWNLQKKRKLANDMLHNYEKNSKVEDEAVVNYLRTIKFLVQGVPNRKAHKT